MNQSVTRSSTRIGAGARTERPSSPGPVEGPRWTVGDEFDPPHGALVECRYHDPGGRFEHTQHAHQARRRSYDAQERQSAPTLAQLPLETLTEQFSPLIVEISVVDGGFEDRSVPVVLPGPADEFGGEAQVDGPVWTLPNEGRAFGHAQGRGFIELFLLGPVPGAQHALRPGLRPGRRSDERGRKHGEDDVSGKKPGHGSKNGGVLPEDAADPSLKYHEFMLFPSVCVRRWNRASGFRTLSEASVNRFVSSCMLPAS